MGKSTFGKVAVLMGGKSGEREISLKSGRAVVNALRDSEVDAHSIDVDAGIFDVLRAEKFARAFIALHGCGGEDGTLQGGLEIIELPYTGSGVMGSSICMDKVMTKRIWSATGINSPGFEIIDADITFDQIVSSLGAPFVVKPSLEGSSLGIHKVESVDQYATAIKDAEKFNGPLVAEPWIDGSEYTVAVLNNTALPVIRLQTPRTFYDYEAKYLSDSTEYLIPCGLSQSEEAKLKKEALRAFSVTGAQGWGRVDVMFDKDRKSWFLEVNTVPGMTDHSLVPMAAASAGIEFKKLVINILETSFVHR